ncbi:MAG: phage tail tape measure protein [Saccharospirillaceae bacterium]|nr:phage tail tape measure protein [Saccharospirillaceae bacterium]MCD8530918.1 phage tail tape measure protein [Saccharospirillaceae bacterium]
MNVSALQKLMFTVGMTDNVSKPLSRINNTLTGVKKNANAGFDSIRGGAFGLGASYLAIETLMKPVYNMEAALGEVRSLSVAEKELQTLKRTALSFSIAYGESATDFVRSSYDIQSAIGGLVNGELATFTEASNILAKATKADAATITNYMGTMYGIFADSANKMGKAQWVQMLTGQTALAVQMFKTTGQEMSGAFTAVGANAQAAGISLAEQMAVLGTLQATMSGSEAGTKYKAFLAGVGNAQKALGLQFTDSSGRMLPMLNILDKLKGKFGESLSVAESDTLKKAFGSDEAVSLVKLLMNQTDGLNASITKLGRNTGMDNARDMAKAMVDPWEQFQAVTEGLRIAFGSALLPAVNDVLKSLTDGLTVVMGWTQEFPHLTKWIGLATLGVLLLGGVVGAMSIIVGVARAAWAGLLAVKMAGPAIWMALTFAGGKLISALSFMRIKLLQLIFTFVMGSAPLWATVLLIGLIVAAVVAGIYYLGKWLGWWDKIANWLTTNTDWGEPLLAFFDSLFSAVGNLFSSFDNLADFEFDWSGLDTRIFDIVGDKINGLIDKLKNLFSFDFANWSADFSWSDLNPFSSSSDIPEVDANSTVSYVPSARESVIGMMKGSGGNHWGGVVINAENGMSPADLEHWSMMQGG